VHKAGVTATPRLFLDADACPVKDEAYRVAARHRLPVHVVSNAFIRMPDDPLIARVLVDAGPDAADDWIAERCGPGDIVVTQDIPLADRALKAGAQAIHPTGRPFTPDSIGAAIAGREIGEHLRSMGVATGGPKPFAAADRSKFLQELDAMVHRARKALVLHAARSRARGG
jgi:uncharacterized protein YaiI (UPF0178 family)